MSTNNLRSGGGGGGDGDENSGTESQQEQQQEQQQQDRQQRTGRDQLEESTGSGGSGGGGGSDGGSGGSDSTDTEPTDTTNSSPSRGQPTPSTGSSPDPDLDPVASESPDPDQTVTSPSEQLTDRNARDTSRVDEVSDDIDQAVDQAAETVDTLRETDQQDVAEAAREQFEQATGVAVPTERELAEKVRAAADTPTPAEFAEQNRARAEAAIAFLEENQALSPGLESPSGEFEATTGPPPGFSGLAGGGVNAPRLAVQTAQRFRGARGLSSIDEALRAGNVAEDAARRAAGGGGSAAGNIVETTTRGRLVRDAAVVGGVGAGTALSQDGELPATQPDRSELPVSEGGRGSEISVPDDPTASQREIAVPDSLNRGGELPQPAGDAVVMASLNPQQIGRGRQRENPRDIPEEFIPDDDVTIGREEDGGPTVGRPEEQPQPTSPGANPRVNRRRQRREQFLDRGRVSADIEEQASEPEVTEPEADLPRGSELAETVTAPRGSTDIGVVPGQRDRTTPLAVETPGEIPDQRQPQPDPPRQGPPRQEPQTTPEQFEIPEVAQPTQPRTPEVTPPTPSETGTPTQTITQNEPTQPTVPRTLPPTDPAPNRVQFFLPEPPEDAEATPNPALSGDRAVEAELAPQETVDVDERSRQRYEDAVSEVYGDG